MALCCLQQCQEIGVANKVGYPVRNRTPGESAFEIFHGENSTLTYLRTKTTKERAVLVAEEPILD